MNKGRVHGEIKEFERSFEIRSNRIMKCDEKLGKLIFLERRLEGNGIKNHEIWIKIRGEIVE